MKMRVFLAAVLCALFALMTPAFADSPTYVGVDTCKKCHKQKKVGEQVKKWEKSKHSKAYKLLASDKALKKAKEMGITTPPQQTEACLVCHTAGYGEPASSFGEKFDMKDGVQCENCHGPGSEYKSKKVMKKIRAEHEKGGDKLAKKYGLDRGSETTCTSQCHQKERVYKGKTYVNPSYKTFDYKERVKEIAHPIP